MPDLFAGWSRSGHFGGVRPWDPTVFVAVPVLLTLIALLAVLVPAVRAR
jgi:hypothetical protein